MHSNDDLMTFLKDDDSLQEKEPLYKYKILIADDNTSVHSATILALSSMRFDGYPLEFYHTYSGDETIEFLKKHEDIALLFLDVVMETDDAGLRVVETIRETLDNKKIRIVLRTGQPGQAPELEVISKYDINDYKTKVELTTKKLFTTTFSALRGYRDIKIIERQKLGYKKVIDASSNLYQYDSLLALLEGMLIQLGALTCYPTGAVMMVENLCIRDGMIITENNMTYDVLATTGSYNHYEGRVKELPDVMIECIKEANEDEFIKVEHNYIFAKHTSKMNHKNYFFMETEHQLKNEELLKVFIANAALIVDNFLINEVSFEQQKNMIIKLGQIMEGKDLSTYFHMNRVSKIAKRIAEKLGISPYTAGIIEVATSLHDVGKVIIPDHILNKPGRLTEEEFNLMKSHCEAGFELFSVSNSDVMKITSDITLCHHERYDGNGYPRGLKAQEIPIEARIATIADVFDALSHDRVYRKAWSFEETLSYIKSESGKIFDPDLVEILLDHQEEIRSLSEAYQM